MRLIDADALKAYLGMSDECEKCKRDARLCQFDQVFTRMDVCEIIDEAPTVGNWISVKDRLPVDDQDVLVWLYEEEEHRICTFSEDVGKGIWDSECGWRLVNDNDMWMPLPELPEVEE